MTPTEWHQQSDIHRCTVCLWLLIPPDSERYDFIPFTCRQWVPTSMIRTGRTTMTAALSKTERSILHVHRGSREKFLFLFGNRFLVLFGNRISLKYTFYTFGGVFHLKKIQAEENINVKGEWQCSVKVFLKWHLIHLNPVPGPAQSIQTGQGNSLCSCSGLSLPNILFLLTILKQDQKSLYAPCPYCLCQAGASSQSAGIMQTQDCYTWS